MSTVGIVFARPDDESDQRSRRTNNGQRGSDEVEHGEQRDDRRLKLCHGAANASVRKRLDGQTVRIPNRLKDTI